MEVLHTATRRGLYTTGASTTKPAMCMHGWILHAWERCCFPLCCAETCMALRHTVPRVHIPRCSCAMAGLMAGWERGCEARGGDVGRLLGKRLGGYIPAAGLVGLAPCYRLCAPCEFTPRGFQKAWSRGKTAQDPPENARWPRLSVNGHAISPPTATSIPLLTAAAPATALPQPETATPPLDWKARGPNQPTDPVQVATRSAVHHLRVPLRSHPTPHTTPPNTTVVNPGTFSAAHRTNGSSK